MFGSASSAHAKKRRRSIVRGSVVAAVVMSLATTGLTTTSAQTNEASASVAGPGVPTFIDGRAQPSLAGEAVIREDLWVEAPVDSDFDGANDLVHVEVARPESTETEGVKIPTVYAASP